MPRNKQSSDQTSGNRPFLNPEAEENYLISLAHNLVAERLRNGTATSQEVVHFLNRGSRKEQLERERLEEENKLLRAKTEALQSQKRMDDLYLEAINAMKRYTGQGGADRDDDEC